MIPFLRPRALLSTSGSVAILVLAGCGASSKSDSAARSGSDSSAVAADTGATPHSPSAPPRVLAVDAKGVLAEARAPGTKATVVNLWATWCQPCREEFPELVRFERDHRARGVRVMFVSTDFEDQLPAVRKFLAAQGVEQVSYIKKTGDDMGFIDGLHPAWSGALPASLVFDASGRLRAFWEGAADYQKFESEVSKVLDGSSPS